MIILKPVYRQLNAIQILYDLLSERTPEQSISHKEMPTMEGHRHFVLSKPYKAWYFILDNHDIVGSIYLTKQNEVGISIFNQFRRMGYGTEALKELMHKYPGKIYANINPENEASKQFFTKHGFKHIQNTYEYQRSDENTKT